VPRRRVPRRPGAGGRRQDARRLLGRDHGQPRRLRRRLQRAARHGPLRPREEDRGRARPPVRGAGGLMSGDPGLRAVMSERRQLINVAYRLLGSLTEAEDAVQETYARWYAMAPDQQAAIESPGAWLTTVASRICLDLLGSARARRERYVGE